MSVKPLKFSLGGLQFVVLDQVDDVMIMQTIICGNVICSMFVYHRQLAEYTT